MAEMVKKRRLVNPGRRRRRNKSVFKSVLQKLHFGTKRQRAAAKASMNRGRRRKKRNPSGLSRTLRRATTGRTSMAHVHHKVRRHKKRLLKRQLASFRPNPRRRRRVARRRRRNVSSIVTIFPVTKRRNPSRRKRGTTVARRRRRANPRRRYHRRRRNYGTVVGRSWSTYGTRKRGKRRNPGRRRHYRRHNRSYRRNPGVLSGTMGSVVGVLAGLAVTRTICTFIPAQFATGILGYLTTGAVAVGQGQLAGKLMKNPTMGHYMMVGGLAYLVNKIINDFVPQLGGYTGLGLIGGSSFYVPQVNQNGSMGSFVLPQQVTGAISAAMVPATTTTGMRGLRRTGRLM